MNYSRIKAALLWGAFTGLCWAVTPSMFAYADLQRGYDATGGEMFIPLLPVFAWMFLKTIKEMINEFKKGLNPND